MHMIAFHYVIAFNGKNELGPVRAINTPDVDFAVRSVSIISVFEISS